MTDDVQVEWPVLAYLVGPEPGDCGHFRAFAIDDVPALRTMRWCHECQRTRFVHATVSVADLVRLFDSRA